MLTDTALNNLKPKEKSYEIAEKSSPGLRLRVSPKGLKTWFYRYRDGKKLVKITLGQYPVLSLADARTKWHALKELKSKVGNLRKELQVEKNKAKAVLDKQVSEDAKKSYSVEQLKDAYLSYVSGYKKSWCKDKYNLERVLDKYYSMPACQLSRGDVREIIAKFRESGKVTTSNRILAVIRGMYNWAIQEEEGGIDVNPCWQIKQITEKSRDRALSEPELRIFLSQMKTLGEYEQILQFILLTGCRIGEACEMEWTDIVGDEWNLPPQKTKNKHSHKVFLSPQASALLPEKTSKWVWPNEKTNSGHVLLETIGKKLASVDFGIKKFTAHDLRRSFATWLGENEVGEKIHDRILNHKEINIRSTYNVASYNRPAKEWWMKWGRHIQALQSENVINIHKSGAC